MSTSFRVKEWASGFTNCSQQCNNLYQNISNYPLPRLLTPALACYPPTPAIRLAKCINPVKWYSRACALEKCVKTRKLVVETGQKERTKDGRKKRTPWIASHKQYKPTKGNFWTSVAIGREVSCFGAFWVKQFDGLPFCDVHFFCVYSLLWSGKSWVLLGVAIYQSACTDLLPSVHVQGFYAAEGRWTKLASYSNNTESVAQSSQKHCAVPRSTLLLAEVYIFVQEHHWDESLMLDSVNTFLQCLEGKRHRTLLTKFALKQSNPCNTVGGVCRECSQRGHNVWRGQNSSQLPYRDFFGQNTSDKTIKM